MIKQRGSPFTILSVLCLAAAVVITACDGTPPATPLPVTPLPTTPVPPPVVTVVVAPDAKEILVGDQATLTAQVNEPGARFEWTVVRGKLSSYDAPAVIYTAPSTPGMDVVTVKVTGASGPVDSSVSFKVVEPVITPTPTLTPVPTLTPTATPVGDLVDPMTDMSTWKTWGDDKGSSITLKSEQDGERQVLVMYYTIKPYGYAGITRPLAKGKLAGTSGLHVAYQATGALNTLEVKLTLAEDADKHVPIYTASQLFELGDWRAYAPEYTGFWCGQVCFGSDLTNQLDQVVKVDLAVSMQAGGNGGTGTIKFGGLWALR